MTGPIEDAILAELGEAPGGLRAGMWASLAERGGRLRILRGGAGGPEAETVVLLHGRGHAAPIRFPCWPALAARHRLLAIDLPGFGASEGGATAAPAAAEAVATKGKRKGASPDDALAFFTDPIESFLAAEVGVGQGGAGLALVGHSLGGLIALELAMRARLPVRRLVLIGGMGLGPEMTFASRAFFRLHPERLARALGARVFAWLNPAPRTPLGRRVAALEHELLVARVAARLDAARAFDAFTPLRGPAFHRRDRLAEIGAPVLMLWGERDAAFPVACATGAQALLRDARTVVLARGHSPHLEAPDEALPPLLDFLAAGGQRG